MCVDKDLACYAFVEGLSIHAVRENIIKSRSPPPQQQSVDYGPVDGARPNKMGALDDDDDEDGPFALTFLRLSAFLR